MPVLHPADNSAEPVVELAKHGQALYYAPVPSLPAGSGQVAGGPVCNNRRKKTAGASEQRTLGETARLPKSNTVLTSVTRTLKRIIRQGI